MISWLSYLIADLLVRALPGRLADRIAVLLARGAFALRLPARRAAEANLARLTGAAPEHARLLARRSFEHFALGLVDLSRLGRLGSAGLDHAMQVHGAEHLETARASGRGVIVLSAHLGSWERGAAWLASRAPRVHLAARRHADRRVEALFMRRRLRFGVERLVGAPLWRAASAALRRREWVALMGDRGAPSPGRSVCAWAALLARRTGALVLPAVVVRLPEGGWAACFEPPLTPEACAAGAYREAVRRWLERWPGQWCAFEPAAGGLIR
jgi:KDO2-lipid IV(A) lauroyltransferase